MNWTNLFAALLLTTAIVSAAGPTVAPTPDCNFDLQQCRASNGVLNENNRVLQKQGELIQNQSDTWRIKFENAVINVSASDLYDIRQQIINIDARSYQISQEIRDIKETVNNFNIVFSMTLAFSVLSIALHIFKIDTIKIIKKSLKIETKIEHRETIIQQHTVFQGKKNDD